MVAHGEWVWNGLVYELYFSDNQHSDSQQNVLRFFDHPTVCPM